MVSLFLQSRNRFGRSHVLLPIDDSVNIAAGQTQKVYIWKTDVLQGHALASKAACALLWCLHSLLVDRRAEWNSVRVVSYLVDDTPALPSSQHLHQLYEECKTQLCKTEGVRSPWNQSVPIKFVAADAGFLPPGPWVDFADMVV